MSDNGIESMLERMRPAKPSAALMARLRAASCEFYAQPRSSAPRLRRGFVFPAGIAAAALVCGLLPSHRIPDSVVETPQAASIREAPARPVVEVFAPVESRNYLIEAEPAATIHLPNRPPVRLMRFLWVDDVLCRSENGDAALEFTQTREQWVPVSAVVY
jgi:hypothetical protein